MTRAKKKLVKALGATLAIAVAMLITIALITVSMRKDITPGEEETSGGQEESTTAKEEETTTEKEEVTTEKESESTTEKVEDVLTVATRTPSYEGAALRVMERGYGEDRLSLYSHSEGWSDWRVVVYDADGNEVGLELYDTYGGLDRWREIDYEYNEDGIIIRKNIYEYDGNGELIEEYCKCEYEYHENGKLKSEKDYTMEELYEYDENGHLIKHTYLDTGDWSECKTDSNGYVIERKYYDSLGEFTGTDIYENDSRGNCIKETCYDATGECISITINEYNSYDDLIKFEVYGAEDGFKEVVQWNEYIREYDDEGRIIMSYAGHETFSIYTYNYLDDNSGEVTETKTPSDEGVVLKVTEKVYYLNELNDGRVRKYNASGKVIGIDYYTADGAFTGWADISYEYDDKGNVTKEFYKKYNAKGELVDEYCHNTYTYEYDSNGNIKKMNHIEEKYVYEYDENGKVKARYDEIFGDIDKYNEAGEVIEDIGSEKYEYDANGNVIKKTLDYGRIAIEYSYEEVK